MLMQRNKISREIKEWCADVRTTFAKLLGNSPDAFRVVFQDAKSLCVLYAVVVLVLSIGPFLASLVLGVLVDALVDAKESVIMWGWVLLLLLPFAPLATRLQAVVSELLRTKLWYRFFLSGAEMLAKKPLEEQRDSKKQELFTRVRERAQWRMNAYADNTFLFVLNLIGMSVLAVVLRDHAFYLLVIVCATIPEFIVELSYGRGERLLELRLGDTERRMWHRRWQMVSPRIIEELQLLHMVDAFHALLKVDCDELEKGQCGEHAKYARLRLMTSLCTYTALAWVAFHLVKLAGAGDLRPGQLTFLIGGVVGFSSGFSRIAVNLRDLCKDAFHVDEFLSVLAQEEPKATWDPEAQPVSECPRIEVHAISYVHNDKTPGKQSKQVLAGLSCVIEPGMCVGVVGPSGGGKTTFINLLAGLYQPSGGEILVDNVPRGILPLAAWQGRVGVLLQQYNQFESLTIAQLIEFGAGRPFGSMTDADLWAALEKAQALEFVKALPLGLRQVYGETFRNGAGLSGGEYQRIRIAGIFASLRGLWLLDEPTSQQDPLRHEQIMLELLKPRSGSTVFVTHQLAKCRAADLVLVIENGRVTRSGTHDELVACEGWYSKAYGTQARMYAEAA